jgi:isoaspartyl peptidase/L-asparaginase-like protein (Ntn-hydrolase superfamily)
MNQSTRLLLYLLLNVVLSACTILTVLWIWDRPGQPLQSMLGAARNDSGAGAVLPVEPAAAATATVVKEYPKGLINISSIIGAGSLADEKVTFVRQGAGELQLAGWKLEDSDGNVYLFHGLTLYENGAIILHSGAGMDTAIDLYWNQSKAVWREGETAILYDPLGEVQATYTIP